MAGKGGGAWKVAYADFVTAMMAFFMVMWLTAQDAAVKESVAQYFEDPGGNLRGANAASLKGPHDLSTLGMLDGGLGRGKGLAAGEHNSNSTRNPPGVSSSAVPKMIIYRDQYNSRNMGTVVAFADSSNVLDEESKKRLKYLVRQLKGKFNQVEIRGFFPRRPLLPDSGYEDGVALSYARCLAVRKFLMECEIDPNRIVLSQDGRAEPLVDKSIEGIEGLVYSVEVFATNVIVH